MSQTGTSTTSATSAPASHPERLIVDELTRSFRETAESIVPWFQSHMPPMYFQDTDQADQLSHLRAIIAAKASGRPIELTLRNEDGSEWTSMRPLDYPGVLAELVSELPHDRPLRAAKIHTAVDGSLVLDTFVFGEAALFDPNDPDQQRKLKDTIAYATDNLDGVNERDMIEHFKRCRADYVLTCTPLRITKQFQQFQHVRGTDGTNVTIEPEDRPTECRITVAVGNATNREMLERIATRLSRSQINIHRAYLDIIGDNHTGSICLLGFVISGPDGNALDPEGELWQTVRRDLMRNKWLDQRTLDLAYRNPHLGQDRAEIIAALAHLTHHALVTDNPYKYNADRIDVIVERNLAQSSKIADLFKDRFNPEDPLTDAAFDERRTQISADIDKYVDLEDARSMLHKMVDAVGSVLRTNYFLESRYGLAMRIDPTFLAAEHRTDMPYGVFFVHGRGFNGFHVRFRDIARGGLRVIKPLGMDQYGREVERLFEEAYNLAHAQQLKNKDIPEGGAKAAVLLQPGARVSQAVKGFVDGLLDLITPDPATKKNIIDLFGHNELLYLGPDENITPEHIDWIVERARQRGYPTPTALMSSKPGAGINHKEYGVTSEGVTVFLDVALRKVGIDPDRQPFSVKMTGGPDGDVAGNMIRILRREYGDNARIVGIADGSGCGEDPDGLNLDEMARLAKQSLPVSEFDRSKLGPNGRIVTLDEPDGVRLRNSLHNRIIADAFVPCGGRPSAIHAGNWRDYLTEDDWPSSRVIVEGANLFLTPQARVELSKAGALIVKDSSANKCGVICSSYEIIASMLLSEEEFLAIKSRFVEEVLTRLRDLARREAELLVRVHAQRPQVPLPEVSIRLSEVMIRTADAIESAIEDLEKTEPDLVHQLVLDHLPPVLIETAGDRLWKRTPRAYLRWMMAKTLSARMVYREGFDYLDTMPMQAIAELAIRYLRLETERKQLVGEIIGSELPSRDRMARLLSTAGIFSTLGDDLQERPNVNGE